jgi:hypothetical protein
MLDRFLIYQINTPSYCCYLSKFYCKKETWGYTKVIHEKKKEKRLKKWTQKCLRYLKQWVLRCPLEKKKKKRDK